RAHADSKRIEARDQAIAQGSDSLFDAVETDLADDARGVALDPDTDEIRIAVLEAARIGRELKVGHRAIERREAKLCRIGRRDLLDQFLTCVHESRPGQTE